MIDFVHNFQVFLPTKYDKKYCLKRCTMFWNGFLNIFGYGRTFYLTIAVGYIILLLRLNIFSYYYSGMWYFVITVNILFYYCSFQHTSDVTQSPSIKIRHELILNSSRNTIVVQFIYIYINMYHTQQCMIVLAPSIDPLWCREVPGSQTAVRLIAEQKKKTELTTNVSCDCTQRKRI